MRFGTVEGLYRCDSSCLRQCSEYIVHVESLECEKNIGKVENTKNNENVNDAGKSGKA